jgi:hypothetical protein
MLPAPLQAGLAMIEEDAIEAKRVTRDRAQARAD